MYAAAETTRVDRPLRPLQPEPEHLDPTALGLWVLQLVAESESENDNSDDNRGGSK